MALNPNIPIDDEQKAAEKFVVTSKQKDANIELQAQIAQKIQPIIDTKLTPVRSEEIQSAFEERQKKAAAARSADLAATSIKKETPKKSFWAWLKRE